MLVRHMIPEFTTRAVFTYLTYTTQCNQILRPNHKKHNLTLQQWKRGKVQYQEDLLIFQEFSSLTLKVFIIQAGVQHKLSSLWPLQSFIFPLCSDGLKRITVKTGTKDNKVEARKDKQLETCKENINIIFIMCMSVEKKCHGNTVMSQEIYCTLQLQKDKN